MKQISLFYIGFLFTINSFSQWSNFATINTPICVSTGKQIDPKIISDDKSGAIIVWEDYRTLIGDVYAQRVDRNGYVMWTTNGLSVCTNSIDQITPGICSDGKSGAIMAWSDFRSGTSLDIYAQKIDSNGVVQWTADGIIVANKTIKEHGAKLASDGNGGAYVVWEQQDAIGSWDVYAQHINASGVVTWAAGGIPLTTVPANRINPRVQEDGKGGIIVVWQDLRSAAAYDIYAQRVNLSGTLLWGSSAVAVCTSANTQSEPKIDPKELTSGAYICWIDKRNGVDYDLYAQLLDSNGVAQWTSNGVAVVTAVENQTAQDIVSVRNINGVIVTWKDLRNGTNYDIYAQRLDSTGTAQWATNGVVISNNANDQLNPNICEDMAGGAIIAWQDSLTGNWDIKSQRIDALGNLLWTTNGVDIGIAPDNQVGVKNVTDGNQGSIYVFQDKRMGVFDIYAHHLYNYGSPIGIDEQNNIIELTTYPIPFNNYLTINLRFNHYEKVNIKGYDILGKGVDELSNCTIQQSGNTMKFYFNQTANINQGVYFIEISAGNQKTVVKVIKSNR